MVHELKSRISLLALASAACLVPNAAVAAEVTEDKVRDTAGPDEERKNDEIIVRGRSLSSPDLPTASPVYVLTGDELAHRRQGGLGETLEGLPGVHLDSFGGGASRPVIRGQTLPRIEILSDGANLFDVSSTSPDHAIATDPLLLDGIEVLRGPAATRFGGNAMNGAVNLIDSKVPKAMPSGGYSGSAEFRYGTGDNERTMVGRITAAVGPFFAVHAEGSMHDSDDYAVPKSFGSSKLKDSFANNSSFSMGASWITSKGYLGVAYTRQENEYGLPGHSHEGDGCHTHPTYLHCSTGPLIMPGYDDSHTASIHLRSTRYDVRGDYDDLLPGIAHARLRLSHTDYSHDEHDGDILFSQYTNKVYDGRVELIHKPLFGFTGTLGVQYTDGTFAGLDFSKSYLFLKPVDLVTKDTGVFLNEHRSFGAFDLDVSARQDWRRTTSPYKIEYSIPPETLLTTSPELLEELTFGMDTGHALAWPETKTRPFSAAIAGTWNINNAYSVALQLSRTQRTPSVREIYTKDNNLATNSNEVGLLRGNKLLIDAYPDLPETYPNVVETAKAIDLTLRKTHGTTQFEIGVFHQDIDNYIYLVLLDEVKLPSGTPFRYFAYRPAHVTFTGIDGQVSHQFTPSSKITVFGDYVRSTLEFADDRGLPRMPPGRLGARYEGRWGPLSADLEYIHTFAQNRVATYRTLAYKNGSNGYGPGDAREDPTDGYNMLNATLSYRLRPGTEIYLRGTNLTDELAYSHTSFVKEQSPLRGRNIVFGLRQDFGGVGPSDYLSQPFDLTLADGHVDWGGVYAGLHVSAGSGRTTGTTVTLDGTSNAIASTESADQSFKRVFPGVQAGFNHQLRFGIVLGAEAALSFTGLTGFNSTHEAFSTEGSFAGTDALQARTRYNVDWAASLKGRVGYAVDRWLPYVTGGIALARESQKREQYYSDHDEENEFGSITFPGNGETASATRTGLTVGGGAEYAVSSRLSIKAEYAYNRFSKKAFLFPNARVGVGRDYYVWETVESEYGSYEDYVLHEGSSSVINGRRSINSLSFHALTIGINLKL